MQKTSRIFAIALFKYEKPRKQVNRLNWNRPDMSVVMLLFWHVNLLKTNKSPTVYQCRLRTKLIAKQLRKQKNKKGKETKQKRKNMLKQSCKLREQIMNAWLPYLSAEAVACSSKIYAFFNGIFMFVYYLSISLFKSDKSHLKNSDSD